MLILIKTCPVAVAVTRARTNLPSQIFQSNYGISQFFITNRKTTKTIGRHEIPYRRVIDGILYISRTGCKWKMLLPSGFGSDSTCHRRLQEWVQLGIFKKIWIRLLKEYDNKKEIKWM